MKRVRRKRYNMRCEKCGNKFVATRRDALYCSGYCRTDAWREEHIDRMSGNIGSVSALDETGMKQVENQPRVIRINNQGEVYTYTPNR